MMTVMTHDLFPMKKRMIFVELQQEEEEEEQEKEVQEEEEEEERLRRKVFRRWVLLILTLRCSPTYPCC